MRKPKRTFEDEVKDELVRIGHYCAGFAIGLFAYAVICKLEGNRGKGTFPINPGTYKIVDGIEIWDPPYYK